LGETIRPIHENMSVSALFTYSDPTMGGAG